MMPVKKFSRMPGMLGDIFSEQWPELFFKRDAAPQVNIIESDKKFKIEIAAPGMSKDDLKVELTSDNQLIVTLEKDTEKDDNKECKECDKEDGRHYLRREFYYSSFRQIFNIPDSVDRDHITAKIKHGVLRIRMPKHEGNKPSHENRQIAIE